MENEMDNKELINEEIKKDNNPISVRIDQDYKDIFEELVKRKGFSKKKLLETIILNYANSSEAETKMPEIDLSYEVSLISGSLDEILGTINNMVKKYTGTLDSKRSFYEQQINNFQIKIQTFENTILDLEEKNKIIDSEKKELSIEKENYKNRIKDLEEAISKREAEINSLNNKNIELYEQLNLLRKVEKDNAVLINENESINKENNRLKLMLNSKDADIDFMQKKIEQLNKKINDMDEENKEQISEMEAKVRKDTDLCSREAILQLQSKFNDIQAENIRLLITINEKAAEINGLKKSYEERLNIKKQENSK